MAARGPTIWDRWEEVDRLFADALDLDAAERDALLLARSESDPDLARAVRALLEGGLDADEHLSGIQQAVYRAFRDDGDPDQASALHPGQRVGRYTVVEELGRGGMATVYLAERSDGAFERRVALKVLRRGLDTEEIVGRFLAERQILSGLNHPNVARLLDGGATDDGRPYLVMERVEGESITAWADGRNATVTDRLELFLQVADAVQFAHSQLIVHRDLKPSNVLVDAHGRVKLLDFGIAKLLTPTQDGVGLTRTGALLPLTPEYASPEQLRGERVTTASDVFQLGELLYVLLTGQRPFSRHVHTLPRAIGTEEATRPSEAVAASSDPGSVGGGRALDGPGDDVGSRRATTGAALARRLRGDVDLILLKALRPEPDRRYASVEQLAEDVRRYLDGRPVLARPDSVSYRAAKFVGRHPAGVSSAIVAAVLLLGFGVVSAIQARRLAVERDRARLESAKAAQVSRFVTGLFEVSQPDQAKGETITARELLDSGAARVRRELADQPEVQAEMLATIGRVYASLGLFDRARPLLEDALGLNGSAVRVEPRSRVEVLRQLGEVTWRLDYEGGTTFFEQALRLAEAEYGPDSPIVADLLTDFAPRLASEPQRVAQMLDRAVRILRTAPGDNRAELAGALAVYANSLGGSPEAIALHRESLALRREIYGDFHTAVAASLNDLGLTLERTDPLGADSLMSKALAIDLPLLGRTHTTTLSVMNNLAGLRRDRGDYEGAEPLYREVLEARREAYPGEWQHAYPLHGLGWVLSEMGRPDEAEPYLREAVRLLEDQLPGDHPLIAVARSTLGRSLALQGRYAEAEPLLVEAFERIGDSLGPQTASVLQSRVVMLYVDWGRPDDAKQFTNPQTRTAGTVP